MIPQVAGQVRYNLRALIDLLQEELHKLPKESRADAVLGAEYVPASLGAEATLNLTVEAVRDNGSPSV